ncbi:MAG: Gldg family protein [Polyangiaceae bacterium]|nr:Gldg family protein [Polyangiaceae bacterium]
MALTDDERDEARDSSPPVPEAKAKAESQPPPPAPPVAPGARPAPLWVVPAYVAGLLLVYLGERVLEPMPTAHVVVTALGLGAVSGATLVRFLPKFRVGGERSDIEKLLGALSVLGVAALAIYFVTSDFGWDKTGLSALAPDTAERVRGVLSIVWVVLVLLATLPMLFAEAALLPMRHAERPEARRVRAAAVSGLTLVIAATYGALFAYSADKVSWRADYSYFKTSRPSDSTRKIAESLNEPLEVVAFFPQVSEVKSEVKAYLDELGRGTPNLKIEIQDRLLVPKRAKELKATQDGVIVLAKGSVTESLTIGVEEKNARPKLKTLDRDFQEKLLKMVRARRVAYLTVGHGELNDPSHGEGSERAVKIARTILQKQNYLIKDLGLSQGLGSDVPDDADVVLVLGPTEPFAREELAALERYGSRGGKLFIALDPDAVSWAEAAGEGAEPAAPAPTASGSAATPAKPAPSAAPSALPKPAPSGAPPKPAPSAAPAKPAASGAPPKPAPSAAPAKPAPSAAPAAPPVEASKPVLPAGASGLVALGRVAGVEFSPVVLANDKQHVRRRYNDSDRTLLVTNRFSSHASVSTLSRNSARAAVGMFGAGSLERASGATEKVDFALKAVTGTFADENRNYRADGAEKPGAFNLAAAVTRPRTAEPLKKKPPEPEKKPDAKKDQKSDPDEMRAFVLADADAVTDVVLANVVANQVLFADAVRWLGGEESFAGEVNTEEDVRIEHTKQKDLVWFYATIFGAPALILGAGLFFARRGKKKGGAA